MAGLDRPLVDRGVRFIAKTLFTAADLVLPPYRGPRILIYHQIGAGLGRQMEVTEEAFDGHLSWLAENTTVVDLDTALARRAEPEADRLVVLTFDDGYEDLYRLGFPLLAARRLPFLLYLTTQPVETRQPFGPPQAIPLTWDQVEEMGASGLMTLGAHTHRHTDLRLLTQDEVSEELSESNALIERRFGISPRHFAYPYGYWSGVADAEVRKRYVTAALGGGSAITPNTDSFLLHRLPIQLSDGLFFFQRKLRTGLRLEESARRAIKRYYGP